MVHSRLITAAAFLLLADTGFAQSAPPLPPPRPDRVPALSIPSGEASGPAPTDKAPSVAATPPTDCLNRVKAAGFDVEATEQPSVSNDLCRIEDPVRLKAVPVPSRPGTVVRLTEEPLLACRFAERFGQWLGNLVAPVIAGSLGTELKAVRTGPGFECRNRNRAAMGKLSAHAEGLAVDIAGLDLANGATLRLKPEGNAPPNPDLATLRTAACGWFTTVLGPGSDAAHHDHLHVDIEQHGSSDHYRICQ